MATPIVYGPSFSTYTRTVRLVFEEKGAEYELKPVNIMAGEGQAASHISRHPFAKVPSFEHDGFSLYETIAIARYVDRVFPGPSLQPSDPKQAARMDQIIAIVDSYAYAAMVGKLVWQRLVVPMQGGQGDEAIVKESYDMVRLCLSEFERLKGTSQFLAGPEITLADCFLAPIFAYLTMTPDAEGLLQRAPGLRQWWSMINERPSMQKTPPQFG
ncbi:MAG TPA: glutathione S-transferase family protein [Microvirga sp.]|nr:glutathione S-transferase family protein [Microvirga sp.]